MTDEPILINDLRRTLRVNQERLLALPGVLYATLGRKTVGGERRPSLSIRVYVRRKRSVSGSHRIPSRLRAVGPHGRLLPYFVPTDVERAPENFRALALRGGVAIEGWARGNLGLVYRSPSGRKLGITSAHVVSGPGVRSIGAPVTARVEGARRRVGRVRRTVLLRDGQVNRFDASVFEVTARAALLEIGSPAQRVTGMGRLRTGSPALFFYASGARVVELVEPEPVLTAVAVDFPAGLLWFRDCVQLRLRTGTALRGHSGSLVVRRQGDGLLACGLLFAGAGRRVLVNALAPALSALAGPLASDRALAEDVSISFA